MTNAKSLAMLTVGLLMLIAPAHAIAADIHVPDDYRTIQAAIEAADHGDTIIVAPGTYNEAIDFLGKAVSVRSSGGAAVTIIDATGIPASVVHFHTGEGPDSVLDGFTITGGTGTPYSGSNTNGGGIRIHNAPLPCEAASLRAIQQRTAAELRQWLPANRAPPTHTSRTASFAITPQPAESQEAASPWAVPGQVCP